MPKKSPAKTPVRKAVTRAAQAVPSMTKTTDLRQRWIAEAAYYRAERRGFEPGRELDDWLEAEKEMDGAELSHPTPSAAARRRAPRAAASAPRRSN